MDYFIANTDQEKNEILNECENFASAYRKSDGSYIIPVCDCQNAVDKFSHKIASSDQSWFARSVESMISSFKGVAFVYPRLGF